MRFLERFRRTTSSLHYLPEVDGLRFVAIFLVVFQMHLPHFIDEKFFGSRLIRGAYLRTWILEGTNGVILFFIISGFILALPFARAIRGGAPPVRLRDYFLRRFLRLEPPYLIVLTGLFAALVLFRGADAATLFPHYLASFFYLHQQLYDAFPVVMPVAWTLEIEVSFYLLAPLLFQVFRISDQRIRILLYLAGITASWITKKEDWPFYMPLLPNLRFFLIGIALADGYQHRFRIIRGERLGAALGLAAFLLFFILAPNYGGATYVFKVALLALFVHLVLTNNFLRALFSRSWMTVIGGICYSVYLLHFTVLSVFYDLVSPLPLPRSPLFAIAFYIIAAVAILVVSGSFFLLVEKPFMRLAARYRTAPPAKGL